MVATLLGCAAFQDLVSARLDGELDERDSLRLAAHLDHCTECSLFADRAEVLHRAIRLRPAEAVPDLSVKILGARPLHSGARSRTAKAGAALSAAAVLVAVTLVNVAGGGAPAAPMSLAVQGLATPAAAGSAAAVYLEMVNQGGGDRLVGARVADASGVSLHVTDYSEQLCVMRPRDSHEIADAATTVFAPGGSHLMLEGMLRSLEPGDQVEVELIFESSEPVRVVIPVVAYDALEDWAFGL